MAAASAAPPRRKARRSRSPFPATASRFFMVPPRVRNIAPRCAAGQAVLEVRVAVRDGGLFLHPAVLPQREQDGKNRSEQQAPGNRPRDEQPRVGIGHDRSHQIEINLVRSIMTDSNPWLFITRPISGCLLLASILSVLFALWQHRRMQKKTAVADGDADF